MLLIICAWIYCFLLSLSIGAGTLNLISRFAGNSIQLHFNIFYRFWFGFVIVIGLLQIISIFLPVSSATFIILSLIAALFGVMHYKSVIRKFSLLYEELITPRGILSLLAILFLLSAVAYSANREVLHSDTFIYHFNAVKWIREYAAVPGLANLHSRLGFNSSFFLFAAFTETGLNQGHSSHIALSFMMAVCLIQWFFIISNPREQVTKKIFCMLTTLFLVNHIISQIDITSLSTDYPMAVLTLVFCLILLDKIKYKMLLLLPLSAVIFTIKLSGMLTIGIALIMLAGYILFVKYEDRSTRKPLIKMYSISFGLLCFVVAGFMIRNAIVSGWLVYPFPVGNLHLPWSVPTPYVKDMMDWIKSYPKIPGGASPTTIRENDFIFWFTQWYSQFKLSAEFNILCVSLFLLALSLFQTTSFGKFIYARLNILVLVLFSVISILFWFISAPELRFGSIYFFILFAGSAVLLYEGSKHKNVLKILVYAIFIYQVINRMPSYVIDREPDLFTAPYVKPLKLKKVIGSPAGENPPLFIYMPAEGDACGNSPIPCTPYAGGFLQNHRLIRQRVPGDLSKGFLPTK